MNFTSLGCAAVYQRTLRQYDGLSAKTLRQLDGLSTKTRLVSGWINIVGYKSTDSRQTTNSELFLHPRNAKLDLEVLHV